MNIKLNPIINLPKQPNRVSAPLMPYPLPKQERWDHFPNQHSVSQTSTNYPDVLEMNDFYSIPLTQQQQQLLHLIQEHGISSNQGVSIQFLIEKGKSMFLSQQTILYTPVECIMNSDLINQLLSNGHIYNTIDRNHFKPTNLFCSIVYSIINYQQISYYNTVYCTNRKAIFSHSKIE